MILKFFFKHMFHLLCINQIQNM